MQKQIRMIGRFQSSVIQYDRRLYFLGLITSIDQFFEGTPGLQFDKDYL